MLATPPLTREPSPQSKSKHQSKRGLKHAQQAYQDWQKLSNLRSGPSCIVDGISLEIPDLVAVAKYGASVSLASDPHIRTQIEQSIKTLNKHLQAGHIIYGVTTGFGGSADTRTNDTVNLQRALVQHQGSGVLSRNDIGREQTSIPSPSLTQATDFDVDSDTQSMPTSWVRASMLTRCNSIIRGHSGVRECIAETILTLLRLEITPIVPLRGSISASGDLSPLSYIAATLEGSPDIFVRVGRSRNTIMTAQQALKEHNIEPIVLRAKEGLGLLNGTAFSAATASLALHQSQEIAIMSQILTAMGTEAMNGTAESFHPLIAEMRPHPGQIEAAANILSCLHGSKLAIGVDGPNDSNIVGLAQDRYALRTSSQWIGPQLEDLRHAHEQMLTEINSTTDNPLIDIESDHILHGGNFQAAVVTSAMDRTRLALEKFGRMLFAQVTELINPATNKGLSPNLSADDPSLSYTCKGIDINMAAYSSELSFLANPVGTHVMSAEMHNQSINSMAFVSARYTLQALDVTRIMCAAYLFAVCQALDLRVQHIKFLEEMQPKVVELFNASFPDNSIDASSSFAERLWIKFAETWPTTTTSDLADRAAITANSFLPLIVSYLTNQDPSTHATTDTKGPNPSSPFLNIAAFTSSLSFLITKTQQQVATELHENRLTIVPTYLGAASAILYTYVRSPAPTGLGIGFHRGLVEHPTYPKPEGWSQEEADARRTIGSRVSVIYEAIRDGKVADVVFRDVVGGVIKVQ